MKQPEKSIEQCRVWMNRLPIPKRIRKAPPLLTEQVTETAVQVALERMKRGSSLGLGHVRHTVRYTQHGDTPRDTY